MSNLIIRLYGDPCLRKKSIPIKTVTDSRRELIQAMIATMREHKGIGLAAPQIGLNERLIVVDIGEGPWALINPQVHLREGAGKLEEGCLSMPGITVNVARPQKIFVEYLDENNRKVHRECQDLLARVILHEIDHLDGRLIIDYAPLRQKLSLRKQLQKIKKEAKKQEVKK